MRRNAVRASQELIDALRELADEHGYSALADAVTYIGQDVVAYSDPQKGEQGERVQKVYDPDDGRWLGDLAPVIEHLRNGYAREEMTVIRDERGKIPERKRYMPL